MAINWPSSPTNGQYYQSPNGDLWVWNGYSWKSPGATGSTGPSGISYPYYLHATKGSTTGTSYTCTISGVNSYNDGDHYFIQPDYNSTDGNTININGIGAVPVYKEGYVPLNYNDIVVGNWYEIKYNASSSAFFIDLPHVIRGFYNFDAMGGTVGTYTIGSANQLGAGICLRLRDSLVTSSTGITGGSATMISIGLTSGGSNKSDLVDCARSDMFISYFSNAPVSARNVPYGSFDIGGTSGTLNNVTIGGVNILNGTVSFSTNIANTAKLVASNINTNPNCTFNSWYTSTGSTATVYLYPSDYQKYYQGSFAGATSSLFSVGASSSTLLLGNFKSIGSLTVGLGMSYDTFLNYSSPSNITMTIYGNNITSGTMEVYIPYHVVPYSK